MNNTYQVVDDFQVGSMRVLVLDRDYDSFSSGIQFAEIDGVRYPYALNSVRAWVVIESSEVFQGKAVTFVR